MFIQDFPKMATIYPHSVLRIWGIFKPFHWKH